MDLLSASRAQTGCKHALVIITELYLFEQIFTVHESKVISAFPQ